MPIPRRTQTLADLPLAPTKSEYSSSAPSREHIRRTSDTDRRGGIQVTMTPIPQPSASTTAVPYPHRRQSSLTSKPQIPSSLGSGRISSSPRSMGVSRDREDLRRKSLVAASSPPSAPVEGQEDPELLGFLSMIETHKQDLGRSFMAASMLRSRVGMEGEAGMDRSVLLEQSRVRY